ncbi:MAG: hypothetical protein JWM95_2391 [Gemmatimonadetes bacterium]|nr:hypothetical protein [Gemmatimonadota bacterium]
MLPERYDPLLVVLSFAIAVLGSFTALSMVARLRGRDGELRVPWLLIAILAQSTGIWSMHFTGMLALELPVPISWDVILVVVSFAVAASGTFVALLFISRRDLRWTETVLGGVAIGAGIAGLHFTDMAAMHLAARTVYSPLMVVASVAIAIIFGLVSLSLSRRFHADDPTRSAWRQLGAAFIMGAAIAGQHYVGMAAVRFAPASPMAPEGGRLLLPPHQLHTAVLLSALVVLVMILGAAALDRRYRARVGISERLLAAQESERRRIARSLHDDLGQTLSAIRLNLQRLVPGRDHAQVLEQTTALVDEALARVRTIALELRPAVLDDLGLAAAATWYANRAAERSDYRVSIDDELGPQRLPQAVETASFRVLQQALTNVSRHAHAGTVRISLHRDADSFVLEVEDDGVGFDVPAARARAEAGDSLGLLDMSELATLAGGTLAIASAPTGGSIVRARFFIDQT